MEVMCVSQGQVNTYETPRYIYIRHNCRLSHLSDSQRAMRRVTARITQVSFHFHVLLFGMYCGILVLFLFTPFDPPSFPKAASHWEGNFSRRIIAVPSLAYIKNSNEFKTMLWGSSSIWYGARKARKTEKYMPGKSARRISRSNFSTLRDLPSHSLSTEDFLPRQVTRAVPNQSSLPPPPFFFQSSFQNHHFLSPSLVNIPSLFLPRDT